MTTPWIVAFSSLSLLVLVIGVAFLGLLRRLEPLLSGAEAGFSPDTSLGRPGGLEPGALVPAFRAAELDDTPVTVETIRRESAVLLLLRARCGPCEGLVDSIADENSEEIRRRVIAVISTPEEIAALRLQESGMRTAIQDGTSVFDAFSTTATPFAFAIDLEGRVRAKLIPSSAADLMSLLALDHADHRVGEEVVF